VDVLHTANIEEMLDGRRWGHESVHKNPSTLLIEYLGTLVLRVKQARYNPSGRQYGDLDVGSRSTARLHVGAGFPPGRHALVARGVSARENPEDFAYFGVMQIRIDPDSRIDRRLLSVKTDLVDMLLALIRVSGSDYDVSFAHQPKLVMCRQLHEICADTRDVAQGKLAPNTSSQRGSLRLAYLFGSERVTNEVLNLQNVPIDQMDRAEAETCEFLCEKTPDRTSADDQDCAASPRVPRPDVFGREARQSIVSIGA